MSVITQKADSYFDILLNHIPYPWVALYYWNFNRLVLYICTRFLQVCIWQIGILCTQRSYMAHLSIETEAPSKPIIQWVLMQFVGKFFCIFIVVCGNQRSCPLTSTVIFSQKTPLIAHEHWNVLVKMYSTYCARVRLSQKNLSIPLGYSTLTFTVHANLMGTQRLTYLLTILMELPKDSILV